MLLSQRSDLRGRNNQVIDLQRKERSQICANWKVPYQLSDYRERTFNGGWKAGAVTASVREQRAGNCQAAFCSVY